MKRRYIRKVSFALLVSLLLSLSLPVLTYAASIIKIVYDATSGQISGVIYSDKTTVALNVYENSQVTDITYGTVGSARPSATQGVYFFDVNGNIGQGKKLEKITVSDSTYVDVAPTVTDMTYTFDKDDLPPAPAYHLSWFSVPDYNKRTFSLTINWKPVNVPDLQGYNVYLNGQKTATVSTTRYTFENLPPDGVLPLGISAFDKAGHESSKMNMPLNVPGMFESISTNTEGKAARYALKPSENFIIFTPSKAFPKGSNLVIYMSGAQISPNVAANDVELVKSDGTAIPIVSVKSNIRSNLELVIGADLSSGQQYTLRMSSQSDGTEIVYPNNTSNGFINVILRTPDWLKSDEYQTNKLVIGDPFPPAKPTGLRITEGDGQLMVNWNANTESDLAGYYVYLDGKLLTNTPITTTTYTITGLTNGKTYHVNVSAVDKIGNESLQAYLYPVPKASTSTGGGFVPVIPAVSTAAQDPCAITVNESSLKNDKGIVAVQICKENKQVLLPANASAITKDSVISFTNGDLTAEVPSSVIEQLKNLIPIDGRKDAQISFSFDKLSDDAVQSMLGESQKKEKNVRLKAAGDVYEFTLSIKTKDGKEQKLSAFDKPITLKLKVAEGANGKLLGVYYIGDDGKLEYVGGKLKDGFLTVDVRHFSKYAVLEYSKSFDDVSAGHWAANAIKEMAAAHVITGVSENQFAPSKQVTRAEFAAFLVRKLGLQSKGNSPFADVAAGKWYADEVAAATEAGLVTGRADGTFAPDAVITRQEMIVMLVKAYALSTGEKIDTAADADFADQDQIGGWAKSYVNAANKLGFIQGRGDRLFVPQGTATRAEAALLIAKL